MSTTGSWIVPVAVSPMCRKPRVICPGSAVILRTVILFLLIGVGSPSERSMSISTFSSYGMVGAREASNSFINLIRRSITVGRANMIFRERLANAVAAARGEKLASRDQDYILLCRAFG